MVRKIFLWVLILCLVKSITAAGQNYPPLTVVINDTTASGYFFLAPVDAHGLIPSNNPTNMILDSLGRVVYYRQFTNGTATNNFNLQHNGLMSYSTAGHYYLMDSTFTIVDSVRTKNGVTFDSHDMIVTATGHFLLLGTESIPMDLSNYYYFNGNGSPGSMFADIRSGVIQEQDSAKNVVFEWHAHDYYAFADVDSIHLYNPNTVDWTHFNTIAEDTDGNLLVSVRHFDEITKIDRSTGAIIWRLGGKANQFAFLNDPTHFIGQHGIGRIDNGDIMLLDNGQSASPNNPIHPVTAKEYTLDETAHTANLTWSYVNNPLSVSSATGNVQRLTNGNTLVNYGFANAVNSAFDIITPGGQKSMQVFFNDTLNTYWAYNYSTLPWKLPRPDIHCAEVNGQYFLVADSGYASYRWSTGDTTQSVLVVNTGSYNVFVPVGNGGFISSEYYVVNDINNPCNISTGVSNGVAGSGIRVYPNPFTNHLFLNEKLVAGSFELFNIAGHLIWSDCELETTDFSFLAPGSYLLKIHSQNQTFVEKLVVKL